jgi:hypothetical protein
MDFKGGGYEVVDNVKPGKSIKPGICQAKIKSVTYGESANKKTPYIEFIHETEPVTGLEDENGNTIGQTAKTTMYITDKTWDIPGKNYCVKARLTIMADKLGLRSEFNAIDEATAEAFVNAVAKLFTGKKARWVFGGEWSSFENQNGETITFVRPHLATFGFVESTEEVLNDEDTKLKFNEEKMVTPLPESDDTTMDSTTEAAPAASGDAPW